MADFEQQTGNSEATPYRLGEVSAETKYIDRFKVDAPTLLNDDLEGQDVILVDHNEFQQSAETIAKANIVNVVIVIELRTLKQQALYTIVQNL